MKVRALPGLLCAVVCLFGCDKDKLSGGAGTQAEGQPSGPSAPAASPEAGPPKEPEKPKGPPKPLNVLLLTVDSLRADMPWNGYDREIAPNLSKLAEQSVVYTNAYSVSSYTAKSVAAILSGRYPSTLYRNGFFFAAYSAANEFFPEALQAQGIPTLSWHGHLYFNRGKGLDQGFKEWHVVPGITFDAQTDNHITSHKMTELGIELLSKPENTRPQFFAWAHYMDPHDQYIKHKESPDFGDKNRDRYDSEVFYTDLWLGKLFEWAEKQAWWKDTAVIIHADHGEAFGEHGMYKHAFELWEVLTRVPLIIKAPGADPKRIDLPRSAIDLAPTIMELMGQRPLDGFVGQSLVPEVYGAEEPKPRDVIVTELAEDSNNPQRRAIRAGDYKLIAFGEPAWQYRLHNLKADPEEKQDLAKTEPEKLEEMKRLYQQQVEEISPILPYGGNKLRSGRTASGPAGPPKSKEPERKKSEGGGAAAAEQSGATQPGERGE